MKQIEIDNITFAYKSNPRIFENFSLKLQPGEQNGFVTAVMGASGSGKSTLLKLLLGIEKPQTGNIRITPENPIVAYVPQEPVLFEHLSLQKNARYFEFAGAFKQQFNKELYNELVEALDLKDVLTKARSVVEISGGQKQRLSLLRALSINPDFLLMDEPCNGLDAEVKRSFLNKLRSITEHYGLFVLYITHHKLEAQLIADEVAYLSPDAETDVIRKAVKAPILDFIRKPPLLEAAEVFRFPDVKILPVVKQGADIVSIAERREDATHFWLVEESGIRLGTGEGWSFRVVSKSPVYSVIRHDESQTEWMLSSQLLNGYALDEMVALKLTDDITEYNKNGILNNL